MVGISCNGNRQNNANGYHFYARVLGRACELSRNNGLHMNRILYS
jgi:hypothetical protein